jgi:hypothetical protein
MLPEAYVQPARGAVLHGSALSCRKSLAAERYGRSAHNVQALLVRR